MVGRRVARIVSVVLLGWIAVDLAGVDTCALDINAAPPAASTAEASLTPPGSSHPPEPADGDRCICHSQSVEPGTPVRFDAPSHGASSVADGSPTHPLTTASALYHPPQPSR
jgi:hypothetical protein